MRDSERLELLKEVAGTRVYDTRKEESLKIMLDTGCLLCECHLLILLAGKIEKIDEVLQYIDERLHELEAEQTELKEYEQLDKTRRSLEYSIYNKEYLEACAQITQVSHWFSFLSTLKA